MNRDQGVRSALILVYFRERSAFAHDAQREGCSRWWTPSPRTRLKRCYISIRRGPAGAGAPEYDGCVRGVWACSGCRTPVRGAGHRDAACPPRKINTTLGEARSEPGRCVANGQVGTTCLNTQPPRQRTDPHCHAIAIATPSHATRVPTGACSRPRDLFEKTPALATMTQLDPPWSGPRWVVRGAPRSPCLLRWAPLRPKEVRIGPRGFAPARQRRQHGCADLCLGGG